MAAWWRPALLAWGWPLPDALVAGSTDRRLSLRDRLLTALHLTRNPAQTGMEQAVVTDALAHIARVKPREAFPLRANRATKVAGLCLVLMLAAQFAPIPAWLLPPQERDDRAALRREAAGHRARRQAAGGGSEEAGRQGS